MAKSRDLSKKGKKHTQGKKRGNEKSSAFRRPRHERLEIKFDPEARRKYLTSFSSKKKERRAFGLAMQQVKDRKAKLEEKKEVRKARLEQVEEAEKSKEQEMNFEESNSVESEIEVVGDHDELKEDSITRFTDQTTKSQFGGQVIVTTTYHIPSDDEDDDDDDNEDKNNSRTVDKEQMYAGSVQKYMAKMKGQLPSKKNRARDRSNPSGKKGKHGAQDMKGMGSATDFKLAKKTLSKVRDKQSQGRGMKGKRGRR